MKSDERSLRLMRELAAEGSLRLPIDGECMAPLLAAGQRVELARRRFYWPGDVVAFRGAGGRLLLHRVIGYRPTARGWRLLTQADGAPRPDSPVDRRQVIGRLVASDGRPEAARVPLDDRLRAGGRFLRWGWGALRRRL